MPDARAAGAHELSLHKWSGTLNIPDPIACAVDPLGRVYVTSTARRKVADLDIREHLIWVPNEVALSSVAEKSAFLRAALAPGKLRLPRGMLNDHNQDGSIDWKDLTVHTERIYQLRDTDGDGTADRMTIFAEGFNSEVTGIAAGVLYHDGWVYAAIAPDLWRFKDTDDDGIADIREVLVHGFGVHLGIGGHDMHGLSVGPDGRIYWSIGDKGSNVTSKEGRNFFHPHEGAILRIEPDGTGFEVYAHGVRNPQEPAFDDFGDLFMVDNDADMKGERERFAYLAEGSDSGWRQYYHYLGEASPWMREGLWRPHFAGQAAYLLPAISNYSDGPAGFKSDPGTALSDAQRGLFLLSEFPSGKMRGFRVEREGATFKMADARVLSEGIMGIGMSWHPDGSLMIADWIGGYPLDGLGALWRVDARDGAANPARRETHTLLAAGFADRGDAELAAQLAHRDRRVRQGAQLELAKRGKKEALLAAASGSGSQLARLHALWGYGQLVRRGQAELAALRPLLRDSDPELRAQAARVFGDAPAAKADAKLLIPLLVDAAPRVRLQAAIALGKLAEPAAVEALFAMADQDSAVPVLRHAVIAGLTGCARPEQLAAKSSAPSAAARLVSVVALRRQRSPAIAEFLRDADPLVVAEAARGIHDDESIPAALPRLAARLDPTLRDEVVVRRAINANLRVGTVECATRLLELALNAAAPRPAREEALAGLLAWKNPPALDRVDGHARELKPEPIERVLAAQLEPLLALDDSGLRTRALEIVIAHGLVARAGQIAPIVFEPEAPGELRAQALRLLGKNRQDPLFQRALDAALAAEAPAPLHRAALELLVPEQPERLVREAQEAVARRSDPEKQHAIALLARAAHPQADAMLDGLAAALLDGTCPPALKLDVIEALRARAEGNPALAARLAAYSKTRDAATKAELLAGGSVDAGREIVVSHLGGNCMACHSIEATGGSAVGPNLRAIGVQRDAAYLLESLLAPAAKIATGYGLVSVTLKDGTELAGTLAKETAAEVTVRLFSGVFKSAARSDIASQSPPISIMPSMDGVLQPRELRDVVAFLGSLDGRRRPATPPPDGE